MSTKTSDGYSITPATAREIRDRIMHGAESFIIPFSDGGFAVPPSAGWDFGKVVVSNDEHVNVAFTHQSSFKSMLEVLSGLDYNVRTAPCSIGYALAVLDEGKDRQQQAFLCVVSMIARWFDEAAMREGDVSTPHLSQIRLMGMSLDSASETVEKTRTALREMCVEAVRGGSSKAEVARAAGVSRVTLEKWLRSYD